MKTNADNRSSGIHAAVWVVALGICGPAAASALRVSVVDSRGQPVEHVAVYAEANNRPPAASREARATGQSAIMDQAHNAFVPHILVVETGTSVVFPNNDTVSHHVYSFSEAKNFELGLYKGNAYPPLTFDKPGVVVLGCNIHDGMLGYIVVVDTPHFALTNRDGEAALDALPPGEYTVHVWTPRSRPDDLPLAATTAIGDSGDAALQFRLEGKLLPSHDQGGAGLSWKRY